MSIRIAKKLKPFTHIPGKKIPLPGTALAVQPYPALLRFLDLSSASPKLKWEIALDIPGPVENFTAELDLGKGLVRVWGKSQKGFYLMHIHGSSSGVGIFFDKVAGKALSLRMNHELEHLVHAKEWFVTSETKMFCPYKMPHVERLSLGSHKKQDWSEVCKRSDLVEILPIWYQLGQILPEKKITGEHGSLSLLAHCKDYRPFHDLFLAGFEGLMCPRLFDSDYQGFSLPPVPDETQSPLPILTQGKERIRKLFFSESESKLEILPHVPREFPSGRLVGIKTSNDLTIDIEWTKGKLRKMIVQGEGSLGKDLVLQKGIKSFRLKTKKEGKGQRIASGSPLTFDGTVAYLDNFTK